MIWLLKKFAPAVFNDGLHRCNELAKKLVARHDVESFLDVGCGDGRLTMEFAEIIRPKKVCGIEFVDEVRKTAELRGIECRKEDLNQSWSWDSHRFDVVLSSQNIEHVHNTRLYLEECYRCLKPGGQLIVTSDNLASWVNIFALVCGWQPFSTTNINAWSTGNPWIWHADEPKDSGMLEKYQQTTISGLVGHVRVLAYRGLKDLMLKVGFERVQVRTRGYLPFAGIFSDLLCWLDYRHGHFLIGTGFKD